MASSTTPNIRLVVSIIGDDQPGLVGALSNAIALCDGNWLQSSMSRLGEKFAGIALVEVAPQRVDELKTAFAAINSSGLLTITVDGAGDEATSTSEQFAIELTAQDQPGIVARITEVLGRHQANIIEIETTTSPAPMGGFMLFTARIDVAVPGSGFEPDALSDELESIANDMMVDLDLSNL